MLTQSLSFQNDLRTIVQDDSAREMQPFLGMTYGNCQVEHSSATQLNLKSIFLELKL